MTRTELTNKLVGLRTAFYEYYLRKTVKNDRALEYIQLHLLGR